VITVLGGGGFIGGHLVRHLERLGIEHQAPPRGEPIAGRELGKIVYCIGLTADFRQRPHDAIDAHVCELLEVVRGCSFESLLYLSSARVYLRSAAPAREDDALRFEPLDFEDLFNLSKAMGESIVLALGERGRVARPSNVYGPGQHRTFLAMLLEEARQGSILLQSALRSQKDYVHVADVVDLLAKIALGGRERIYNVASGVSVTSGALVEAIAQATGCSIGVLPDAPAVVFPRIDIERARSEFGFAPSFILDDLPSLIAAGL
jgi:nucleoside-diphosphate-sugar epimerase